MGRDDPTQIGSSKSEAALLRKKAISSVKKHQTEAEDKGRTKAQTVGGCSSSEPKCIYLLVLVDFFPKHIFHFDCFFLLSWYLGLSSLLFSSTDPSSRKCFSQGEAIFNCQIDDYIFALLINVHVNLVGFEGLSTIEVWIPSPQKADCFRLNMLSRPSRYYDILFSLFVWFYDFIFFFHWVGFFFFHNSWDQLQSGWRRRKVLCLLSRNALLPHCWYLYVFFFFFLLSQPSIGFSFR